MHVPVRKDQAVTLASQITNLPEVLVKVLEAIHEGIYILDSNGRFIYANPAYTRILGVPVSRIMGRRMADVQPDVNVLKIFETKEPILGDYVVLERLGKHVVADQSPILDNGELLGVISVFRDVTEVAKLDEDLRKARGMLSHLKEELRRKGDLPVSFQRILGTSDQLRQVLEVAYRAAKTDATVLITGESGVGKELVARAIHEESARRQKPLVTVNCAALPDSLIESELFGYADGAFTGARRGGKPGKFELADGGTLFLDEVAELSPPVQAKLLRALQERQVDRVGGVSSTPVDIRIMAATNADLLSRVQAGTFREDLYYRLHVIPIHLPPLRERVEDIPALVRLFLDRYTGAEGRYVELSREALKFLMDYSWPGNVRELQNVVQYICVMAQGPVVTLGDLPPHLVVKPKHPDRSSGKGANLGDQVSELERSTILDVLRACHGNRSEAIRRLGISRAAFYRKLREYGVMIHSGEDFPSADL